MHGNGMRGRPTRRRHSLTPGGGGAARGGWLAGRNEDEKVVQTGHEGEKDPQKRASHPIRRMLRHAPPPRAIESPRRGRLWNGGSKHDGLEPRPPRPAPPPRAIDPPPLRPPPFPRRTQQERACSSALAPGSDAMYCIVYYCPRAPSVPCLLLVICRQAHRTAQQYSIPSPWPMHACTPVVPNSHAVRSLCSFAFPSRRLARCSSPPLHLGLNYSGRRLRLAMSPVCLRRSAAGMDVW